MTRRLTPTPVRTTSIDDVRRQLQSMGDTTSTMFNETRDLKVCQTAIVAYNAAINAAKTQLIYKKLTGEPAEMVFLHGE